MCYSSRLYFTTILSVLLTCSLFGQTSGFSLNTRLSFYSSEKKGEVLLHVNPAYLNRNISVYIIVGNDTIGKWNGTVTKEIVDIPVALGLNPSQYILLASIKSANSPQEIKVNGELIILQHKINEVKTDRLTGGLIVDEKPFFPFGFYCYSPVYSTLPEEEAVKGFNMISPYQKVLPATLDERMAYMDRCAELGMKVHYNLLSVSGGGGVGSQIEGLTSDSARQLLVDEIHTFMDHPALLAWYISDEPFPSRIEPDSLSRIYSLIKELDPWHPVSIVFMAPFTSTAKKYASALDIVMADPYPVPDMQPSYTGTVTKSLFSEFKGKNPVWLAAQSFGGGEIWRREPTSNEVRQMVYQAIINGATGIQFFIRHGLNSFPKSVATWGECGKMAVEIQELTPWLLSPEKSIGVTSSSSDISLLSKVHNGKIMVMAANKSNTPKRVDFSLQQRVSSKATVLFENRNITISGNSFTDYLPAYGTQVYMIDIKRTDDSVSPYRGNLIIDPGFEDLSTPGIPSACYAWNLGDRGATFFTDSRESVEGDHSIRLITPKQYESVRLRFFPVAVKGGTTYYLSIWAKGNNNNTLNPGKSQYFELALNGFGTKRFELTNQWKQYIYGVYVPYYENTPKKLNITLTMSTPGTGWFDMVQMFEGVDISKSIAPSDIRMRP